MVTHGRRSRYLTFVTAGVALLLVLYSFMMVGLWRLSQQLPSNSRPVFYHLQRNRLLTNQDQGYQRAVLHEVGDDSDSVAHSPRSAWKKSDFECLGWIETDDGGTPTGNKRECWQRVRAGDAGFCEVGNRSSGERFQIMRTSSLSLKDEARFTCQLARAFTDFQHHADNYHHDPPMGLWSDRTSMVNDNGIVMTVHERVLPSAFASIRRLRDVKCSLPIELWFRHDELSVDNPVLTLLRDEYGPVLLRQIYDERIHGFNVKIHALYYSEFANVLLLDADNFAVRDPTSLFETPAFLKYGAVFWPDFWHPGNTIFNLHAQSLAWELLGIDYVNMMEQESGQILLNRYSSRLMLERLLYFVTARPNLFEKLQLVWGDKDLFRLAWLQLDQPFHFNAPKVPGLLGVLNRERQRYCGLTMVQYSPDDSSDILFLHRNTVKLSGAPGKDRLVWQALQEFPLGATQPEMIPQIQSFSGERLFNEPSCFGVKRYVNRSDVVVMERNWWAGMEVTLIRYAQQAHRLLHQQEHDS